MRVLVTGCAGFIGSNFVWRLLENTDVAVVGLDKMTYAADMLNLPQPQDRFYFDEGDICDAPCVAVLMDDFGVDAVVNFAAESHVDRSIEDSAPFLRTNVEGVRVLLEECEARGIRMLQVGTDEVYGQLGLGENRKFTEETPLGPRSPYSASKAAADLLALSYHHTHGTDVVVTRCSNNYGPRQHGEKLIPTAIRTLRDGGKVPVYGDGLHVRDWLHVEDHCSAILAVLEDAPSGTVWNVGGEERGNLEVVEAVAGTRWTRPG
jgi:dTDP-glucose 4,6-dehydratase